MSITQSHAPGPLVTKQEAMAALRVSLRTVDRYIKQGQLTAVRLSERNTKITSASLEAMLTPDAPAASPGGLPDVEPSPSGPTSPTTGAGAAPAPAPVDSSSPAA